MTVQAHSCRESYNPRRSGYCDCGQRIRGRDAEYEREWLDQVEAEAQRRFNVDTRGYRNRVEHRLAVGADRYGDASFLDRDNMVEILEETPDVAGYSLLETQKILGDPTADGTRAYHLFQASVLTAAADWHARQAARSA